MLELALLGLLLLISPADGPLCCDLVPELVRAVKPFAFTSGLYKGRSSRFRGKTWTKVQLVVTNLPAQGKLHCPALHRFG